MQHIFLVVLLLLLGVVHNVQAQFFSSSKSTDESVLNLEANAEKVLDGTEHVLNRAWKWTTKHRQVSDVSPLEVALNSVIVTITFSICYYYHSLSKVYLGL